MKTRSDLKLNDFELFILNIVTIWVHSNGLYKLKISKKGSSIFFIQHDHKMSIFIELLNPSTISPTDPFEILKSCKKMDDLKSYPPV